MSKQQQKSKATAVRRPAREISAPKPARDSAGKAKPITSKAKTIPATARAIPGTAKATNGKAKPTVQPAFPAPSLYGSLHALLQTMRLIERHEESLCSMQDELKRTGRLSAARRRSLLRLVEDLPAADYQADLEDLRRALTQ